VRPKPLAVVVPLVLAGILAGPAIAGNGGFAPVDPESPTTERVNDAYWLIAAFAIGVLLLVTVPLLLFIVRYRSRGRSRTVDGAQVHGNTGFELAWTAVPILILVVIASFVFYKLPGITDPEAEAAGPRLTVRVEGRQFYWRYVYPNGAVAVDTLRVPVGRLVELEMTAPDRDVIHSYWVPALFGKRDTIPGETTELRFVARRPGLYEGQCGEFCGIQHALMRTFVRAVPPSEFDAWVARQARAQEAGTSDLGRQIWEGACEKCHRLDEDYVGPALGGNPTLSDRRALSTIVRNGRRGMPAVGRGWTEGEMTALFRYTRDLGGEGSTSGG
jgi:cytochrome c oxidase subunit II